MSGLGYQAYVDRASSRIYFHVDTVYPYPHVFMSQVPNGAISLHLRSALRLARDVVATIIDRVGIDPKYKGGPIRMVAALAAINRGVSIDVVLKTGRWASWQVFDRFYNRARLNAVALGIGLTSLASILGRHVDHDPPNPPGAHSAALSLMYTSSWAQATA